MITNNNSTFTLTKTASSFINFLRAISSQIVLIGHALALNNIILKNSVLHNLPSFAVLIFFILSGFVIAYSTKLKGVHYGLKNYVIDRFARIYITLIPALLIIVTFALIYLVVIGKLPYSLNITHLFANVFMQQENTVLQQLIYRLPNNPHYKFLGFLGDNLPLWSLSIEWWHYMFFGLLFFIPIKKYNYKHLLLLVLTLPFVVGYLILPGRAGYGLPLIWFSGVFINWALHRFYNNKLIIKLSAIFTTLFFITTLISLYFASSWAIIYFALFFCCGLFLFTVNDNKKIESAFNLLKWPSNYSFSLYIIHYPILLLMLTIVKNPLINTFLVIVLSNVLALIMYLVFEHKHKVLANYLKKRFS